MEADVKDVAILDKVVSSFRPDQSFLPGGGHVGIRLHVLTRLSDKTRRRAHC